MLCFLPFRRLRIITALQETERNVVSICRYSKASNLKYTIQKLFGTLLNKTKVRLHINLDQEKQEHVRHFLIVLKVVKEKLFMFNCITNEIRIVIFVLFQLESVVSDGIEEIFDNVNII